MKYDTLIDALSQSGKGILKIGDVMALGVSKPTFRRYVDRNGYRRIGHGVYISPDAWMDEMYVLSLRSAQVVFSHDSALYLYNMTDREPLKHTVTVQTGYNPFRLTADGIKVYTVKKDLYGLGITECNTMFGHSVRVYNPERTVCDIMRSRNGIEIQTFEDALKRYVQRKEKDINLLIQYAKAFHVDKMMISYLRVML